MIGVTGINGFLGGCLLSFFQKFTDDIVGLSTKPRANNIVKLIDGIPSEDIRNITTIIHCGGLVGNGFEKIEYQYANIVCTEKLLRWCEKNRVEQFVFFSTGGVYGDPEEWVDETAVLNPNGFYTMSKLSAEEKVLESNLPIKTIIRLYFPFGDLQYNHLFSRIARDLRTKNEVFLNDQQGHPYISPIYSDDICSIVSRIISKKIIGIYNLSANIGITIGEIVDVMSALYGITPQKHIRNIHCGNYLGKADKIIKATDYCSFFVPQDMLRFIIRGVS